MRFLAVLPLEYAEAKQTNSLFVPATQRFNVYEAQRILRNITVEDAACLGYRDTHPSSFILTTLSVIPVNVRPPIPIQENQRNKCTHALTQPYKDIGKVCDAIIRYQVSQGIDVSQDTQNTNPYPDGVLPVKDDEYAEELYRVITQFFLKPDVPRSHTIKLPGIRSTTNSNKTDGNPIMQHLNTKKGLFRGHMSGKRSDFAARSVAVPNTNIDVDEVGIPRRIAMELTCPERVYRLSKAKLQARVRRGDQVLDGARYILKKDGTQIALDGSVKQRERLAMELCDGDIVERFLQDGDWVAINRQPSLHRMSYQTFKVRIVEDDAVEVNPACCDIYNLDYDGDEVNIAFVQCLQSRAESEELMSVHRNFLNVSRSIPSLTVLQDVLEGAFLLSRDCLLSREEFFRLIMTCRYQHRCFHAACPPCECLQRDLLASAEHEPIHLPPPAMLKPLPRWTGKQALQYLLPRVSVDLGDRSKSAAYHFRHSDKRLLIIDGEFISGVLTKRNLGKRHLSIAHIIAKDMGSFLTGARHACNFLSDLQRLAGEFMRTHQLSVGIDDMCTSRRNQLAMNAMFRAVFDKMEAIYENAENMTPSAAVTQSEHFEQYKQCLVENQVQTLLLGALTKVAAIVETDMDYKNSIHLMAQDVRSKGNPLNIGQIMGCLGQQLLYHQRLKPRGELPRLLPYFEVRATVWMLVCHSLRNMLIHRWCGHHSNNSSRVVGREHHRVFSLVLGGVYMCVLCGFWCCRLLSCLC